MYGKGYGSYQGLNRVWGPGSVYTRADSRLIELEEEKYKQYQRVEITWSKDTGYHGQAAGREEEPMEVWNNY